MGALKVLGIESPYTLDHPLLFVKLIKIAFQEHCFNHKKPEHGVAAVRTMKVAFDTSRKLARHPLKGMIGL